MNAKYLWLLLSVPLLLLTHFFALRHLKTRAWLFANFEAIRRVTGDQQTLRNSRILSKNIFLLIIQIFIVIVMIFSVAGTTVWYTGPGSENNFVLAIDASSSMLANDFQPNRLEAAKESAKLFVDSISSKTKIGVVSFGGTSFVEQALTTDFDNVKNRIDEIDIKRAGGTDLGEAMITSVNMLLFDEKSKVVVLLTDGRDTVGTEVAEAVNYANDNHAVVHTIGIGTEEGGSFIDTGLITTLDEETLKLIALKTGGEYFRAESEEALREVYERIATFIEEKLSIELQMPLLLLALAFIFLEWGLINTRYRTLP